MIGIGDEKVTGSGYVVCSAKNKTCENFEIVCCFGSKEIIVKRQAQFFV